MGRSTVSIIVAIIVSIVQSIIAYSFARFLSSRRLLQSDGGAEFYGYVPEKQMDQPRGGRGFKISGL
ncbi:hypothetical protein [Lacrimispora sp.]|uniref:hypothetical protein n=1 Tax=Lacrimispora sp. TaxID=2719234 RepID=UPI0028B26106|nr:hypothetical protein [Lacrimispora sp.]